MRRRLRPWRKNMHRQTRKKKKSAPVYSPESLMLRSAVGIVLIALGVLTLLSVFGGMRGEVFTVVKRVVQGLGGTLCFAVPLFLIWGGGLAAFSARHHAPVRPLILTFLLFLCVLALMNLMSTVLGQTLMEYTLSQNLNITPPIADADGYWRFLKDGYQASANTGMAGGFLGMLLAWPLWRYLGGTMGVVILILCCLGCLLAVSRFDVAHWGKLLKQKNDERLRRQEEERERQAREKAQKPAPVAPVFRQGPAYSRRAPEAPAAQTAQYSDAGYAYPAQNAEGFAPQQVDLYDEWIMPQDGGTPSWRQNVKTPGVAAKAFESAAAPTEFTPIAPEPTETPNMQPLAEQSPAPKTGKRQLERLNALRGKKESLEKELYGELKAPPAVSVVTSAPTLPAPVAPVRAQASVQAVPPSAPAASSYQRSAAPAAYQPPVSVPSAYQPPVPTPTAYQPPQPRAPTPSLPMSGVPLDTPTLVLPEKKKVEKDELQKAVQPPYAYPTLDLLNLKRAAPPDTRAQDAENAGKLEETLQSFGIPARVQRVTHGPAVTRFELGLVSSGINVKRIMSIVDNIALDMAARGGVRIEIPIPGTNLFGVEVPNKEIIGVTLAEVLTSPEMSAATSPLAVALGRDIAGKPVICDLSKMPHLLIAGQTGSGKSVCINAIINSILYRSTPEQVRMIMIDPKVVELQCYNVVPHLLIPVVSDPHKASGALAWAVAEMLDRYQRIKSKNVREINGYNAKLEPGEEPMPRIVIIIDELADLMMACKKDVEESICRLAQLARAAGIHLVVATQRPTVDVITGLIKANIPSRIAFAVSSSIDSRTILDATGAEKLLGRGDMFYYPTGESSPIRVQGCFLSDAEIENVVHYIAQRSETDFDPNIIEVMNSEDEGETQEEPEEGDLDPRLPEAIEMALTDGQASISMLQRRMKIGYARAGRLIDDMAARGIVSKSVGSKPREVLMTREQFEQIRQSLGM